MKRADGFKGFGFVALDLVSPIHAEATLSGVRPFLLASFGSALFSRRSFMGATSAPRAARMKAVAPAFMVRSPVSCTPFAIGESGRELSVVVGAFGQPAWLRSVPQGARERQVLTGRAAFRHPAGNA